MHNRTEILDIYHIPNLPLNSFPINFPGDNVHSPSDKPLFEMHFHDSLEIGYCYEGGGIFFSDGELFPFCARDVSIIFKNQLHIAQSDSSNMSKWDFISLVPELLLAELNLEEINNIISVLSSSTNFPNILSHSLYPMISQTVLSLIGELNNKKPGFKSYVKALVWQLFIELKRITNSLANQAPLLKTNIQALAPALEFISNNYMNKIEIAALEGLCHTSDRNLRRLFVKSLNLSPQLYIIKFRIHMASSLLRTTNNSILMISSSVGFSSLSSFNRQFKKLMGVSPRCFRGH